MTDEERLLVCGKLVLRIHVITGWVVPADEFMNEFINQFQKKMAESYSNINADEIEYAMRNKPADVKDWGKMMNLSLIDEVIAPYLEQRLELSRFEEQKKIPSMVNETKEEITDEGMIEWIEQWKNMSNVTLDLIPLMFYDFLVESKIIEVTKDVKWEYIERATIAVKVELHSEVDICKTTDALRNLSEFERMEMDGFIGTFKSRIINKTKRLIIYDYLKPCIKT